MADEKHFYFFLVPNPFEYTFSKDFSILKYSFAEQTPKFYIIQKTLICFVFSFKYKFVTKSSLIYSSVVPLKRLYYMLPKIGFLMISTGIEAN